MDEDTFVSHEEDYDAGDELPRVRKPYVSQTVAEPKKKSRPVLSKVSLSGERLILALKALLVFAIILGYPAMVVMSHQVDDTPVQFDDSRYWAVPCLLYTSPSPRDGLLSRMPSSA